MPEMSEPTIRLATPEDAPALLAIYEPYVRQTAITCEYEVPSVEEFAGRIERTLKRYPYLVMDSLKMYSKMTDAIRSAVEYLKENSLDTQTLIQHDDQILEVRNKVNKYYKLLHSLSGNLASGVISRDDYALLRERYQTEVKSLESNIEKQEEYMEDLLENKLLCEEWVNTFLEKPSLGDLDRDMLLQYVEKINVFEGRKIEIVYRFQDELVTAARLAEQIGKTKQEVAV